MFLTCPKILRRVIDFSYKGVTFETFLNRNIHTLFHLRLSKCCCNPDKTISSTGDPIPLGTLCKSQWDLLYSFRAPNRACKRKFEGDCPCKYEAIAGVSSDILDVTYCYIFLKHVCSDIPKRELEIIRKIANSLVHHSRHSIDETTFYKTWAKVERALLKMSNIVSAECITQTKHILQHAMVSESDRLEEVWFKK